MSREEVMEEKGREKLMHWGTFASFEICATVDNKKKTVKTIVLLLLLFYIVIH